MHPVTFPASNITYAKDQPEYQQLPAHRDAAGVVTSCWRLTWRERFAVLFRGRIWWQQYTFKQPLQPQRPSVDQPWLVPDRPGPT